MKKLFLAFVITMLSLCAQLNAQTVKVIGITETVTIDTYPVRVMQSGITNIRLTRTDAAVTVNGVEIATTGFYKFDFSALSNYEGFYKLYINDVEKQEYGTIQIATFLDVKGTEAMQGQINMNNFRIYNLGRPVTGIDAVNKQYLVDSNYTKSESNARYVTLTTAQTISGAKGFTNTVTFSSQVNYSIASNGSNYPQIYYEDELSGNTYVEPPSNFSIATKKYVDDAVSTITVTPFQESSNYVRLIPNGVIQIGQVYTSYQSAANYFTSPAATKQCEVFISGTGNTSQYYTISHNWLRNYVHTVAAGKHINLIVGRFDGGASVTKNTTFENGTLWFGANDISTARTYNSLTFKNLVIYAYRDVTFTNCTLINCIVYQGNGYGITVDGSTYIDGSTFTQTITQAGGFTGNIIRTDDEINTTFSMPTDPSTGSSEE